VELLEILKPEAKAPDAPKAAPDAPKK
jgi:hypothetical protein